MNKRRFKLKYRKDTVRSTYEPDYDHEAWESGGRLTPDSVPDAFYKVTEPAHPRAPTPEKRRKPHQALTTSMLRRRLYRAGVRGAEAKRLLVEIMAGEQNTQGIAIPMAWSVSGFRKQFGQRLTRTVLRFVHIALICIDESWMLLQAGGAAFVENAFRTCRKYSAVPVMVEQSMPTPPAVLTRRVSFHH